MALPTITQVRRNGLNTVGYYTASNSGNANATPSVAQQIGIYAVDAADGPDGRFTYEEFFTALNSAGLTNTITFNSNLADFDGSYRTITLTGNPSGEASVVCIRSGTLFHELPTSTRIVSTSNELVVPLLGAPALYPSTQGSASNVSQAAPIYDTEFRGSHEILLGTVYWQMNRQKPFQVGNIRNSQNAIRPADLGDPTKNTGNSPAHLLLSALFPGPNQTFRADDWRLTIASETDRTARVDIDFYGTGIIDAALTVRNKSSTNRGFFHNANFNPRSNIRLRTLADEGTSVRAFAGYEPATTQPVPAQHYYLDAPDMKLLPAFEQATATYNTAGGQAQSAFVGPARFNTSAGRTRIMLEGQKSTSIRYWTNQWSSGDVTECLWVDPSTLFTGSNAPFALAQTNLQDDHKNIVFLRSIGVDNNDANGNGKSTPAWVLGNQASAATRAYAGSWTQGVIPLIAPRDSDNADSDGTWSSRRTDTAGLGNAARVGRGVHYLHDVTWNQGTQGTNANNYTRLDDSDNYTYLLHRGGFRRVQRDISLRSHTWDFNSAGSTGATFSNNADDAGVNDLSISLYRGGLQAPAAAEIASGTNVVSLTLHMTPDAATLATFVGADVTAAAGIPANTRVTRATADPNIANRVNLTISANTTAAIAANTVITVEHTGYQWDMDTEGVITFMPTTGRTLGWTYTGMLSMLQAKLELIADTRHTQQGAQGFNITTDSDSTLLTSRDVNYFLNAMSVQGTIVNGDYISAGSSAGLSNISRLAFGTPGSGGTLTLSPDTTNDNLNFGSALTLPSYVTMNGSFTDATGSPSFIDVVLPSGVGDTDVSISVGYQNDTDDVWTVTANPTLSVDGTRRFIRVESNQGPNAINNDAGNWYLAITGNRTQDFRVMYTGAQNTTVTLQQELFRPTGDSTSLGTMNFLPLMITNPGNASETVTILDTDSDYPMVTYLNDETHLAINFVGYDNLGSGVNLRLDFLAAKVDQIYSDAVMRFGANLGRGSGAIDGASVQLFDDEWRIRAATTSRAEFLYMDGALPTQAQYYVIRVAPAAIFFGAPAYDPSLVRIEVEAVVDPFETRLDADLDRLAQNQVRLSRGIPPRGTVSS